MLFQRALRLVDDIQRHGGLADPFWTFGGGTVLMFRYGHRISKDIDIFVPDPQYLGYVSPRLSEVAEAISADYVEGAGFVKLIRPEGEIDFVASPNLTATPFETWSLQRRSVRVETAEEIAEMARANWSLGDRSAFLVVQPLPSDTALDPAIVNAAVAQAVTTAEARGVSGAALTPFLLGAVLAATEGRSLPANLALLASNARLAGQIAVAFSQLPSGARDSVAPRR